MKREYQGSLADSAGRFACDHSSLEENAQVTKLGVKSSEFCF